MKVYLDHNATSPASKEHLQHVMDELVQSAGNPSSPHAAGRSASVALTQARRAIALSLEADVSEVVFVSGGSEANNLATAGVLKARGTDLKNLHAIVSSVEHPCIREPIEFLARTEALTLTTLAVDSEGRISAKDIVKSIRPNTALVTVMAANNEIGTLQPVDVLGRWLFDRRWKKPTSKDVAREPELEELDAALNPDVTQDMLRAIHFHVDAVQAYGKIPATHWFNIGVDSVSLSAHKLGGLSGIGALVIRSGRKFQPAVLGGAQERNRRAGTENLAGVISFGIVAKNLTEASWWARVAEIEALTKKLRSTIAGFEGLDFNSPAQGTLPNTLNFSMATPKLKGEDVLMELDMSGIYASSGSACSSGANLPSRVILSLGKSETLAKNAIRLSLGHSTTPAEISFVEDTLKHILGRGKAHG